MQLRRALPFLTLALLVLATGCVTVRPAAPPDAPHVVPVTAEAPPRSTPPAWPLGRLPIAAQPAPVPAGPEPASLPVSVPVAVPAAAPRRPATADQTHRPRRAKPARPAQQRKRTAPAKPRKRPPTPARSRPAPQHAYDMASLCEAARGTVPASIVALCR